MSSMIFRNYWVKVYLHVASFSHMDVLMKVDLQLTTYPLHLATKLSQCLLVANCRASILHLAKI